uniref:Uncharacterized protein n=1 Tax=Tetranychus urticae TaxID=32264 RepID=T1KLK1_TETUR
MRFTIFLTLCAIGVASASSLNKRSFIDDIQNQTQNAFHAFEEFSEQAKHNAEEGLKKLLDFFSQFNPQSDSSNAVNVTKRAVTGADLLANIGNPQKAQELLIQLFFESYGKGRKKRDLAENIQKLTGQAKKNAEENLKKLFDFFNQLNPQSGDSSNAVNVTKRAVTGADLLANIGNPQKAQELLIQLFFESYGKGRKRRDLAENIQKLTGQAKQNAEANLKKLFDFFSQFNPHREIRETRLSVAVFIRLGSNAVNVTKRAVTGADLLANIGNPQKAQELLIQLFFESYGKGR